MRILLAVSLVLGLGSCANPINQRNAAKYHDWGMQADRAGDYQTAERNYERALVNARLGHSPDSGISMVIYNLGRVKGHLCKFAESEKLLLEALQLEEKLNGPESPTTTMRLFELARLNYDRGLYGASIPYFARAVPAARKLGAESADPIALADALDQYASALENSGLASDANGLKRDAQVLRARNAGKKAKFVPVRYSETCTAAPAGMPHEEAPGETPALVRLEWANLSAYYGGAGGHLLIVEVNGKPIGFRREVSVRAGQNRVGLKAWSGTGTWTFRGASTSEIYICAAFNARADRVYTMSVSGVKGDWALSMTSEGESGTEKTPFTVSRLPFDGQHFPCSRSLK